MSSVRVFSLLLCLVIGTSIVSAKNYTIPHPDNPDSCPGNLCKAAEKKDESKIRRAIKNGVPNVCTCTCDPDPVPVTNKTLLHLTAPSEAVAYANQMLAKKKANCSVDVLDAANNTALHDAAAACNTPMAFVFLEADAKVEPRNEDGYTPLCVAALTNDPNCAGIVNHLVEYGADICMKCNRTLPFDLAVNKIVKDIIEQNNGTLKKDGGMC